MGSTCIKENLEKRLFWGFVVPLRWGHKRHFQAKRAKYSNVHIMETTAWIPTKFCVAVKTTKYASCGSSNCSYYYYYYYSNVENKSKMADSHHLEKLEKLRYLHNRLTDFNEIWQSDASETSTTRRPLRFLEFEYSR